MTIYAAIDHNDIVVTFLTTPDDPALEGPVVPPVFVGDEYALLAVVDAVIPRPAGLSDTSELFWNEGSPEWRETLTLAALKTVLLSKVDAACDAARAAILAAPTNSEEYRPTAEQAAAFKAAGYTGPVPPGVSTWTHAKRRQGWTDQQATDDILATAAAWTTLLWFIRGLRLDIKELIRDATTTHQADLLLETLHDRLAAALGQV